MRPWSWASLPGLRTENRCLWQLQATPKSATRWRAAITSRRVDGGREGLKAFIVDDLLRRLESGGFARCT